MSNRNGTSIKADLARHRNAAITQRLGKDWVHGLSDAARSAYFRVNQAIQSSVFAISLYLMLIIHDTRGKVDSLYSICSAEFQNDLANRRRVTMLNGWKAQWHVVPNSKMEEDDSLFQFNSVFGPKKEPQDILMKTICLRSSPDPMDVKEMMIQVSLCPSDLFTWLITVTIGISSIQVEPNSLSH